MTSHSDLRRSRSHPMTRMHVSSAEPDVPVYVGISDHAKRVNELLAKLGPTCLTVTVTGETGTGKSVVARLLHHCSGRKEFREVIGGEVPPTLAYSEMFGHEKGAYTGADQRRRGALEQADGGTLFLDELGDMPRPALRRLRAYLDGRGMLVLGAERRVRPAVRLIVGTQESLGVLAQKRKLPADIAYRLYGVEIPLLPLRERREDIRPLAEHFLRRLSEKAGRMPPELSLAALGELEGRTWEGNVRELERTIEVAVYLLAGDVIEPQHLPAPLLVGVKASPSRAHARLGGREQLVQVLTQTRGNVAEAARALGRDPTTLRRWARSASVELEALRP